MLMYTQTNQRFIKSLLKPSQYTHHDEYDIKQLESGPMPNVMAVLPNIGDALCPAPQFG